MQARADVRPAVAGDTSQVVYWIYSLGGVPSDALVSMLGEAHRHVDSFFAHWLQQPVAIAEGLVCKAYQTCCHDPRLEVISNADSSDVEVDGVDQIADVTSGEMASGSGEMGSGEMGSGRLVPTRTNVTSHCLASPQHEGASNDFELTLRDPSMPSFCAYTSGAPPLLLIAPPRATCTLIAEYVTERTFSPRLAPPASMPPLPLRALSRSP